MHHGFDFRLLLDQLAGDLRAHAGAGARTVGHVDAIDAGGLAQLRAFDFLRRVDAARRQNFDEGDEFSGRQLRAESALFGDRHFLQRLAASTTARSTIAVLRMLRRVAGCALRLRISLMCSAVVPQHPPTICTPAQQESARVLRHVFGRAQINVAAFNGRRQPGVGHRAERLRGVRDHLLDGFEHHLRTGRAIQPDHVHRPFVQAAREIFGRGAVPQTAVVFDAQLRDDRQVRRRRLRARRESPRGFRSGRETFRGSADPRRLPPAPRPARETCARASAKLVGPSGSRRMPSGPTAPATNA